MGFECDYIYKKSRRRISRKTKFNNKINKTNKYKCNCVRCESDRQFKKIKAQKEARMQIKEWYEEGI